MTFRYLDAFFYSLMIGAGEAYFAAYSLHLGHSELQAGILVTVPIVVGGFIQMFSPFGINKVKSYKNWTVTAVFIQSLLFLGLIFFDTSIKEHYSLLFVAVTIYWSLALSSSPSWNSWISSLLKADEIRGFFSTRNVILSIGTLSGLCFTGLLLHSNTHLIWGLKSFHFIFLLCFFFRFCSFCCLLKHERVVFQKIEGLKLKVSRSDFLLNGDNFAFKFIIFSALIKVGVYFSASFFAPYMLKQLHFSYLDYMLILVSSYCGRAIFGQFIRKYLKRFDINFIYLLASIGIGFIPILWAISKSFTFIFILEIFTGLAWGAFEIAFFVTCFEEIPTHEQARFMSWYNFLHTIAIGVGCVAGLSLFRQLGPSIDSYFTIFIISSLIRLVSLFYFPRKKIINGKMVVSTFSRSIAVRPNMGFVGRPLWQVYKKFKKD